MSADDSIDAMLATARQWFARLPEGVAEMRESRPNPFEAVLEIRPLRVREASPIALRLGEDGTFDVAAGEGAQFDNLSPDEYGLAAICDAIAAGGLTEELERGRGELIASRARLEVGSETLHSHREQLGPRLRAAVLGGKERLTIRYAPYGPDLARRNDKVTL
jgi:hypothetical protein